MKLTTLLLTFLLAATVALAQDPPAPAKTQAADKVSGNYEGTVNGQAEKVTLELKVENPKLHGRLQVGEKWYEILQGGVTERTVSLVFKEGKFDADLDGDVLTGAVWVGAEKKPIVLKRVMPAVTMAAAAPAFSLNGQWEAVADANGQPFPFLLTLKVDGENVTGSSSSQLGESAVKDGVWKDGKLVFVLEGSNGNISMFATVIDGKLAGEFDYSGQLQGKWVAVKKN